MNLTLVNGDCLKWLKSQPGMQVAKCIIADPPDNLGLAYDGYRDHRDDYYPWLEELISASVVSCDHFWLSYYWRHDLEVSSWALEVVNRYGLDWKKYIWRFTFGQHREGDCSSGFRYLLRFSKPGVSLNTGAIRVPSDRQKIYNDKRANPAGRVPDDVWEFPRVVGNSGERRSWHPTQHPQGVYSRIIRLSSAPGDTVVDLFAGSGTLFRTARDYPDRKYIGVELSETYCQHLRREHDL